MPNKGMLWLVSFLTATLMSQTSMAANYYEIMGVPRTATTHEITKVYRKLAMKYHPDRLAGESAEAQAEAEEKFKEIRTAYTTLTDEAKKYKYDQTDMSKEWEAKSQTTFADSREHLEEILKDLRKSISIGPSATVSAVDALATHVELLLETQTGPDKVVHYADKKYYKEFDKIMSLIGKNSKLATPEVLSSLMFLASAQQTVYGLRTDLSYYDGGFDIHAVSKTAGSLVRINPNLDVKDLFNTLIVATKTERTIEMHGYLTGVSLFPIFDSYFSEYLYEFGLERGLVTDAHSLIRYIKEVAGKAVYTDRQSIEMTMLEKNLPFTLSILSSASFEDIEFILKNLYKMDAVLGYEELIRNGRLGKMSAEQTLRLLKGSYRWVKHIRENRFGKDSDKLADDMVARLKRANIVFAREFSKMAPTASQIKEFVEISEFKFGEYTWAKLRSSQLPQRDYAVFDGSLTKSLQFSDYGGTKFLGRPRPGECKALFLN